MLLPRKRKARSDNQGGGSDHEYRKGRPGRPMKHPNDVAAPRSAIRQQQRMLHEQSQKADGVVEPKADEEPTLSPFERLPTELIQHIFFESMEMSLPLTCTIMNQALSSESVFRSLILLAYFNQDTYSDLSIQVDSKGFLPATYRQLTREDRCKLQLTITGFRWCSLARVRRAMPTLSKLAAYAAWRKEQRDLKKFEILRWYSPEEALPPCPEHADLDLLQARYSAWKTSPIYKTMEAELGRRLADQSGDSDTLPLLVAPIAVCSGSTRPPRLAMRMKLGPPVMEVLAIPAKVLRGEPWTEDGLAFLQLLRQGLRATGNYPYMNLSNAVCVVPKNEFFEGLANAIRERKRDALLTLLDLFSYLHVNDTWAVLRDGEWCSPATSDKPNHLPAQLFHLAIQCGDQSADYLKLLIRADVLGIPSDDKVLTAWALRTGRYNLDLSRWLLSAMEPTSSTKNSFHNGAAVYREVKSIFGGVTFADEIGFINQIWGADYP